MPCRTLARARVLDASSRLAAAGGHIVPVTFLHSPAPKHFSTARSKPPSAAYESRGDQAPSAR